MKRLVQLIALPALVLTSFPAGAQVSATMTYYHGDHLGSPSIATDANGDVVFRETYAPYGKRTKNQAGINGHTTGYTGHQFDKASGLTYMGARFYDPQLGRFLGVDPVPFSEGSVQSFNRYAYANGNPLRYLDPTGGSPEDYRRQLAAKVDHVRAELVVDGARVAGSGYWRGKLNNFQEFAHHMMSKTMFPSRKTCYQQAEVLYKSLLAEQETGDWKGWKFELYDTTPHWRKGEGIDHMFVKATAPDGTEFQADPWLGDTFKFEPPEHTQPGFEMSHPEMIGDFFKGKGWFLNIKEHYFGE